MKKKKSNNLASEFILDDTEQTARMKEMALSDAYSCSGEMYKLLSYEVMHNLVKKIKKGDNNFEIDHKKVILTLKYGQVKTLYLSFFTKGQIRKIQKEIDKIMGDKGRLA